MSSELFPKGTLFIAMKAMPGGGNTIKHQPGEVVDNARDWTRLHVSVGRGELVPITPDSAVAIVELAQRHRKAKADAEKAEAEKAAVEKPTKPNPKPAA